jgi:hypothetical protein
VAKKIKVKIYEELRQSLAGALGFQRGQEVDLRVTEIPALPKRMLPKFLMHKCK